MPESRDRLIREEPLTPIFTRRSASGVWIEDNQDEERRTESIRATPTGQIQYNRSPWEFNVNSRRRATTRRSDENRNDRNTESLLPSWYQRRPLQDISAVLDAIQRRRARLRDPYQQEDVSLLQQASVAPLEHNISLATPKLGEGSDVVTPQKKLINSIDVVEKAFKEEMKKMKNTPAAKRAEREKKVRMERDLHMGILDCDCCFVDEGQLQSTMLGLVFLRHARDTYHSILVQVYIVGSI